MSVTLVNNPKIKSKKKKGDDFIHVYYCQKPRNESLMLQRVINCVRYYCYYYKLFLFFG